MGAYGWRVRARCIPRQTHFPHELCLFDERCRFAGENMKRCVNNNFSFEGFWRQWHATLNKWIIRYMCRSRCICHQPEWAAPSCSFAFRYIPLGGRRTQMWSMWIIFTFVGLWHDLWCPAPRCPSACTSAHHARMAIV